MADEILVDAAEAGRRLGLDRTGFYRLLKSGEIPSIKRGTRKTLVAVEDLNAWVAKQKIVAG